MTGSALTEHNMNIMRASWPKPAALSSPIRTAPERWRQSKHCADAWPGFAQGMPFTHPAAEAARNCFETAAALETALTGEAPNTMRNAPTTPPPGRKSDAPERPEK